MNAAKVLWVNGNLYTPSEHIPNGRLLVMPDGTIGAIGGPELQGPDALVRDFAGKLIMPGFVDVHVHGGGGSDLMSGTYADLDRMSRFHAIYGTTSFLATTLSAEEEEIAQAIRGAAAAMKAGLTGAELIGLHLEGPFLNSVRGGAQNPAFLRGPDMNELKRYVALSEGTIQLVTLAPELSGASEVIAYLAEQGITISIGHSDALFRQVKESVRLGVSHVTHQFNGMRPLHHREPGVAGAALMLPELTIELIADGVHVHPDLIKFAFDAKTGSKVCLITDAVSCTGCPDGDYQLEGQSIRMANGSIYLQDGSSLAGSTLTMIRALRNTLQFTGLPLEQILPSLTITPSRQINMHHRKGSLEPGKDADFVVADSDFNILSTYVRGKQVYASQMEVL